MVHSHFSKENPSEGKFKIRLQIIIVSISFILLIAKFIAFYLTRSIGVYTDAMESIVNVLCGLISLFAISYAMKPKDSSHPFGHGKIEFISASFEGLMITGAGIIIIYESVMRYFNPAEIQKVDIGIYIVAGAGLINFILGAVSVHYGKKHSSAALIASGKHLKSDAYSSIGLTLGLVVLYFTKLNWIDSSLGLVFGAIIIYTGAKTLKETLGSLMDKADEEKLGVLRELLSENIKDNWIDIHNLKMIRYGTAYYIDCDMTLPWYYNISQGHEETEELKNMIVEHLDDKFLFSIHIDPCKVFRCKSCPLNDCPHRTENYIGRIKMTIQNITAIESDNV